MAKWKIVAGAPEETKAICPHAGKQRQNGKSLGPHCPHQEQIPNNSVPFTKAHSHLKVPPPPLNSTDWWPSLWALRD